MENSTKFSIRGPKTGEQLKTAGLNLVEANNFGWVEEMRYAAKKISISQGYVTADDLRPAAESLAQQGRVPKHPNAWGLHLPWWRLDQNG